MSFVFYDTETTGTDTSFDQILQFAAIKTDANLNPIDQFDIRCRLLRHVVPAPGAMRVTGVTAAQLIDPSLPSHYEMICKVREKFLAWSPSLFLGYNSLKFDENILRQAFYKTLHPLYVTNTEGNTRSDVMRMVQAASIFEPSALSYPTDGGDKLVFKLERVAEANGVAHDDAHDAMGDVKATIHICRLLMDKAPDVWSGFMRFSQKAATLDYVSTEQIFCLSDIFFGRGYSWLVTPIGTHPTNPTEFFVYDLSVHPESIATLAPDALARRLSRSPKLVRHVKCNNSPIIVSTEFAPAICAAAKLGSDELERRAAMLHDNAELRQRLVDAFHSTLEEYPPSPHVEKQIYDDFYSDGDKLLLDTFHRAAWNKRLSIVDLLEDARLRQLGYELIHAEQPDLLSMEVRLDHDRKRAHRVLGTDPDGPWLNLPKAIQDLDDMLAACEAKQKAHLREHRVHLMNLLQNANTVVNS
jgi:exodeoxyribonuclease I